MKAELVELTFTPPDKLGRALMVDSCGGREAWIGGVKRKNGAFVDVRLWGVCEPEAKKKSAEAVFSILRKTSVPPDSAYLPMGEDANWGLGGTLNKIKFIKGRTGNRIPVRPF